MKVGLLLNVQPIRPLLRVLFIEDSEADFVLVSRELRKQGYECKIERVTTAEAFSQAIDNQDWDVILSDYQVPGFGVTEALRLVRTRRMQVPFIIVSGTVGEGKAIDAMRAGAHDYIFKDSLGRLGPAIQREVDEAANRRERARAEQFIGDLNRDLQRRISELQTVLDLVPMGIAISDTPECTNIRANAAFTRILELPAGTNISLSVPPAERPPYRILHHNVEVAPEDLPVQRAARGETIHGQELTFELEDGRQVHTLAGAVPLFDEKGRPRGAVGAFADVTDMKRAETMLRNSEKLASVGRLAATIAHEINNPLEAVTNVLYLLERSKGVPDSARELITVAQSEMQRISMIVRQTLGFHREAAVPVAVNVTDLLDDVVNLYVRKLESNGIKVEKQYRTPGEISAYPSELRQVFANLIINAADAVGKNGRIILRASAVNRQFWPERRSMARPGDPAYRTGIRVTIADNGPGIPDSNVRHLFEPFFTTKGEKGTGLGLWVSQGIIAKHGGEIHLRSSQKAGHSGTVFSIFLPRIAGTMPAKAIPKAEGGKAS